MVQDDFFVKTHENFEKTHSSQILRSWDKVFVKSSFLMCEGLNYPFKEQFQSLATKKFFFAKKNLSQQDIISSSSEKQSS